MVLVPFLILAIIDILVIVLAFRLVSGLLVLFPGFPLVAHIERFDE
jgi:hypothetical protein